MKDRGKDLHDRIANDFSYHKPTPEQLPKYERLREMARDLAHEMVNLCPESRELSTALTRLEEAVMHANAAIARN